MLRPLDADAPYDVGPYRLLAGLGSGGMGTVHLALPPDGGPDDLVALKTVRRDLDLEGDFRIRFRREAEAARAVRGPYVSALVAAEPEAARPWLATQYVAGPSLADAVARHGPLPVDVVRRLGADLARGLAAVHGARLVHRDLKPANVVLGASGPRLIDFGIAQAYDATALTATGIMVGSPGFMSPEHIEGGRSVTSASDVFCLGAVLCFAATGHGPFEDSELAAIVHRIVQGDAELAHVPTELREVVADCLRQEPGRRPTTDDLIRTLDPEAASARPGAVRAPVRAPFPWPDGVRGAIRSYEAAVGRALLAPPAPQKAPAGAPPGPGAPTPPVPPQASAPPERAGRRLRRSLGVGAVLLVATLTVVLLNLPGEENGPGEGTASSGNPGGSPKSTQSPGSATERTAPVAADATGDFGPDALDRTLQPEGWQPWITSVDGRGGASDCSLSGAVLVCVRWDQDRRRGYLEARNAADGTPAWRYPADSGGGVTSLPYAELDTRHVYTPSPDGPGVDVLDLGDGKRVARLPGREGYLPAAARVHKGQLFVSYVAEGGPAEAGDVFLRAYSVEDRAKQWERAMTSAQAQSLDIAGDRLWVTGGDTRTLDPKTGRDLDRISDHCPGPRRGAPYVACLEAVRETRTLRKVSDTRVDMLHGARHEEVVLVRGSGTAKGSAYLSALDPRTWREQWSLTWNGEDSVIVAGDRVLVLGDGGVRVFDLEHGTAVASRSTLRGWPREGEAADAPSMRPSSALVSGGSLYLTFEDGTLLSAPVP
ncbi:protein kinase [Streptomyces sp. NPDC021019]|uniref:serine/threonine-protein kinase n=1 Tax=Streptomyces sp. NPDC021019 TaxID=3365108 RepID=UPI0037BCF655